MEAEKPVPTNYEFRFEGGHDNVYAFTTSVNLVYAVRFKPTLYIINEEWVFHKDVYESGFLLMSASAARKPSDHYLYLRLIGRAAKITGAQICQLASDLQPRYDGPL